MPVAPDDFEADTRTDGPAWEEAPPASPPQPPPAPPSIHQMKTAAPIAREPAPVHPTDLQKVEDAKRLEPRRAVSTTQKTGRIHRAGLVDGRYQIEEMLSEGGM